MSPLTTEGSARPWGGRLHGIWGEPRCNSHNQLSTPNVAKAPSRGDEWRPGNDLGDHFSRERALSGGAVRGVL